MRLEIDESVEQSSLSCLLPSFADNYRRSIEQRGDQAFLFYYPRSGPKIQKTFLEFAIAVEQARAIVREKSEPSQIILCLNNNKFEMLVYIFAAILEGRTFCPLSPEEGQERIERKISALGRDWVGFVGLEFQENFRKINFHEMIVPDSEAPNLSIRAAVPYEKDQPMYLIFTSGTTGQSKIVPQLERSVLVNVDSLVARHNLQKSKSIGTFLSVCHVNALTFSYFCTILTGNRFVFFESFSLSQIVDSISLGEIDILSVVPPVLNVFVKSIHFFPSDLFSRVEYIVTAAAPLTSLLAREIVEKIPCRVIQGYGLSEAVNFTTLTPTDLIESDYRWAMLSQIRPSVGTPLAGQEVYVMDEQGNILGEDSTGEIVLQGESLLAHYLNERPQTTHRQGYFHTGDLGFYKIRNERKFYFITGRKKEIIKRMGITVSISEIEDQLYQFPNRAFEAVAVGFDNQWSGEEIALLVNFYENHQESIADILSFLNDSLPDEMRPRLYIVTDRAVKTATGKPKRSEFRTYLDEFSTYNFLAPTFASIEGDSLSLLST